MAQVLTGNSVQSTYESLIKVGDNGIVTDVLKTLSDGLGHDLPVQVTEGTDGTIKITGTLELVSGGSSVPAPTSNLNAANKQYVDQQVATVAAVANQNELDIAANDQDISDLQTAVGTLQNFSVNLLQGAVSIVGTDGITVTTDDQTFTITIDGSLLQSQITALQNETHVDQLNNLVGNVNFINGTHTTVAVDAVNNTIQINATGGGGGGGSDSFNTFTVPTQPDVVADSGNDTMNFVDGVGINMTTNNTTKTITFSVDGLGNTTLAENNIWVGSSGNLPQAVLRDNVYVGFAGLASSVELQNTASGDYGLVLHQGGAGGDGQLYSDSDGNVPTWNAAANLLTMTNANVTGNLQAGAITDVEQAIDDVESDITTLQSDVSTAQSNITTLQGDVSQNTSDIAALQAIPQVAPVVNISTDITIDDDTYSNKFVVSSSGSEITLDNIQAWQPTVGTEIYFMSTSGPVSITGNPTILYPPGKSEFSRGTNSVIGIKCIDAGSLPTTESTWVIFGDLS